MSVPPSVIIRCSKVFDLDSSASTTQSQHQAAARPKVDMDATTYESFLAFQPPGNGCLVVHTPTNETFVFRDLNLEYISEICPLLAFSFDEGANGARRLIINASSIELVARFLRFLYTENYDFLDEQGYELPCSFLLHAQLYHYAELYDVPRLLNTAYIHISQICELGCSMPSAPIGLAETLRYLYQNVKGGREIHETIMHYCLARFNAHKLGEDAEFIRLLSEVKECQHDLHRLNMERDFCDEGSASIIQLRLPSNPRLSNQTQSSIDHLYDISDGSNSSTPAQTPILSPTARGFTLVHRPRQIGALPATEDSDGYSSDGSLLSDFENFSLGGPSCPDSDVLSLMNKLKEAAAHEDEGTFSDEDEVIMGILRSDPSQPDPMLYSSDNNIKGDFSDSDGYDSDWSVVSDGSVAQKKADQDTSKGRSLYMLDDCASSTETVVALADVGATADIDDEQGTFEDLETDRENIGIDAFSLEHVCIQITG